MDVISQILAGGAFTRQQADALRALLAASGWQQAKLTTDFSTSSDTVVDIPGLSFAPLAGTSYEFDAKLLTQTTDVLVGPRPGLAWATGLTDGVADIRQTSGVSSFARKNGNLSADLLVGGAGLPDTTNSHPANIRGIAIAGASPSGLIKLQLASETAGFVVTVKAGSFLRWRQLP